MEIKRSLSYPKESEEERRTRKEKKKQTDGESDVRKETKEERRIRKAEKRTRDDERRTRKNQKEGRLRQCCQPVQIICICPDICVFSVKDNRHCEDICPICQKCQFEIRKG